MAKNTKTISPKKRDNRINVLGVGVSSTSMNEVLTILNSQFSILNSKPFFVVTAYSEFFLEAQSNSIFKKALDKADLIVPDGVSALAAMDYVQKPRFLYGLYVGWKIISGQYFGKTVVGVDLVRKILENKKHKVFLLGGWNGVAEKLAKKFNAGFAEESSDLQKINKFQPDILFVALGRFKQEIWIANNLDKLKCKVVMGVGSSFDELAGEGVWKSNSPEWIEKMGLKWLWRALNNPSHWPRALRASILFPWKVWRES